MARDGRRHVRRPAERDLPLSGEPRVRLASADDAIDILVVRAASWRAAYRGILPERTLARLTERWDRTFPKGTWVIERDALVLGYCITNADEFPLVKKTVAINELYIYPEMWRAGLGSMLLDLVLRSLSSRGATTAVLDVLERNERGIAFYERQGFRHVEGADRMTNVDTQAFRVRQYVRKL